MNKTESKISIVVPVYNTEKYLSKCVESLINQTYKNIEILLIDDGSTDGSGKMCDAYASNEPRINVVHTKNGGPAQARNTGISVSNGDYIMFVDSDDWVDEEICENLLNAVCKYETEIAICMYIREYPDKSLPRFVFDENMVISGKDMQRKLCGPVEEELRYPEKMDCLNSMCGKLYPAEILKKRKVTNISSIGPAEDLLYNFQIFSDIGSLAYINKCHYHYRKQVNDSITAVYKHDIEKKLNNLYDIMSDAIENESEIFHQALCNRIALNTLGLGLNALGDDANIFEKCRRLKKIVSDSRRKEALKQLSIKYMPIHWKVFYFCARHGLSFFVFILLNLINFLRGKI